RFLANQVQDKTDGYNLEDSLELLVAKHMANSDSSSEIQREQLLGSLTDESKSFLEAQGFYEVYPWIRLGQESLPAPFYSEARLMAPEVSVRWFSRWLL
ncbi:MAG: hypothetical protein VW686_11510, partial [Luminiphilus sp.]